MSYILLYSERYVYFESIHNGYTHHTNDFHRAANYKYLDVAMYKAFDAVYKLPLE
jgi:hypothetical protein